jgi:hypothetical protein
VSRLKIELGNWFYFIFGGETEGVPALAPIIRGAEVMTYLMKQIGKNIFILFAVTIGLSTCSSIIDQDEVDYHQVVLIIRTYNHAEAIFTGIRTYNLSGDSLTIIREPSILIRGKSIEKDTILSKPVSAEYLTRIKDVKLDTLNNFLYNHCVMATSGSEYYITHLRDTVSQTINVHHYYHPTIERLINEFNKEIPEDLKIRYVTSKTIQDCD